MTTRHSDPAPAPNLDTARLLNSAAIHLLRAMRPVDAASGLTPARLSALSVLVFGGPCTLTQLARAEAVTGPTMTGIVRGLVDAGLATRAPHADNSRMVTISATSDGEELMRAAAQQRLHRIATELAAMDPEQQDAIARAAPALRELSRRLRERGA